MKFLQAKALNVDLCVLEDSSSVFVLVMLLHLPASVWRS